MPTVHGAGASPFVRKVRACLAEKGIAYDHVPVVPFPPQNATPEYRRMSPLGKIPAYSDGEFGISDSSVICAYLEKAYPNPPLYPSDPKEYARALWIEEYADTRLVESIAPAFFQRVIRKRFFKQEPDESAARQALEATGETFAWLESQLGDRAWFAAGHCSIADIAVATQLVQHRHAGETIDAQRFPKLAAFAARAWARPSFAALIAEDEATLAAM
jgi:glutathione S-transferase